MNGEVSLIVRTSGGTVPGTEEIFSASGAVEFGTFNMLIAADATAYIGYYAQLQSSLSGDLGTYKMISAVYDGSLWTTATFSGFTPVEVEAIGYHFYVAVNVTKEFYLDLFENESINQNWRFTDLNNFQSTGAFSREFRIPFSDRNQLALGPLFDVNYSAGADNFFHYKLPAEIRVDTLPIATGYIRVRKIYKQKNVINEVEIAFYAETPDLFKAIGEKKLSDIAALSEVDELVNYANVTTPTDERIWTLIDRGQLWSEGGQQGTRRVQDGSHPLYASDLTPAVRWDYLLTKIITEAGFELEAGSLLSIMNAYYMPWCNSAVLNTADLGYEYFFRAYNDNIVFPSISSGQTSDFIPYLTPYLAFDNYGSYNTSLSNYTAPGGGRYTFHFTFQFDSSAYTSLANRTRIKVYAVINGTEQYLNSWIYTDSATIDFIYGFDLLQGDIISFGFRYEVITSTGAQAGTADVLLLQGSGDLGGSLVEIIGTKFNYGQDIAYALNAPDMRQIDFVNDVIKMHNCVIVSDRTNPNKISIVPYNSYVGTGDQLDWTSKLDIDKDITIYSTADLQKAKTTFTYTIGDDYLSQQYKIANRVYGDYKAEGYTINPETEPSTFIQGENTVQLVTRSTPCGVVDGSTIIIPQFINLQNQFVKPGPRCLYSTGSYVSLALYNDATDSTVFTQVPTLLNYTTPTPSIQDDDLNWAPETPPFPIIGNPYNNLFNKYWRIAFNELYSPDARIMEASFALDLSDILTFEFSDIIFINDSMWRILEIQDYKVGAFESTKVKLIKYLRSEADCTSVPLYIQPNGIVVFDDGSGVEVASTQSCCTRYGYSWSESAGTCYAFNQGTSMAPSGIVGNSVSQVDRLTRDVPSPNTGSTGSTTTGIDVVLRAGNNNTLAVGDTLKLDAAVRGAALVGKNVYTNLPGLHLGGGWTADNRSNGDGNHQYGAVILSAKDTISTAGNKLYFTIEGKSSSWIELPNDTHMACSITVNVYDFTTNNYMSKLCHVFLKKVGATASASAVTTLDTINTFPSLTLTLTIDTTTNTAQHRISLTTGGTGFPYDLQGTITIQYTQIR